MYNRQYQLWPANQYQTSNVAQVVTHHSTPAQPSYQESSQVAGWDTVPYAGGGHATQVQRQQDHHHGSTYAQGNVSHQSSEYQQQSHQQQQQQQQDSYSGGQYQGQSYYGGENYQQEGWVNYNNSSNTSQQYTDYSQYSQSDGSYNQSGQSSMPSSYEQSHGNYSQANTYNPNGLNASYESPLKVLDDRRTNESASYSSYNVPTTFYSKKLGAGNTWEKKRDPNREEEDFRRPPPIKYDPNTPADIVAKFQTNFCRMCDVKLNSRAQSQNHYEGRPHAKKLKAVLDKRYGITPGSDEQADTNFSAIPTISAVAPATSKVVAQVPDETPKEISSTLGTPMGFVGKSGALKGFVASSTGNLATGLPPTGAEGSNTGVLLMRNSGIKTGLGFVSNNKKKNKKKKKRSGDAPVEDTSDPSAPRKKKKVVTDFSQLYCKCCDLSFTSQEHATEHFMGRNHRRVLYGLKPLSPDDPTTSTELLTKDQDGKMDSSSGKGKFFCEICEIAVTSHNQMEDHISGTRHKQARMKAMASRASGGGQAQVKAGGADDGSSLPMSFFSNKLGPSAEDGGNSEDGPNSQDGIEINEEFGTVGLPTSFYSKKLDFKNSTNDRSNSERKPGGGGGGGGRKDGTNAGGSNVAKRKRKRQKHPDTILASVIKGQDNRKAKFSFKQKDFSIYRTPSGKFYCAPCDITLNSEVQFAQHFESKKHKMKKK